MKEGDADMAAPGDLMGESRGLGQHLGACQAAELGGECAKPGRPTEISSSSWLSSGCCRGSFRDEGGDLGQAWEHEELSVKFQLLKVFFGASLTSNIVAASVR